MERMQEQDRASSPSKEAGHDPAMCTHCLESQLCSGLHQKHCGQQGEGGDSQGIPSALVRIQFWGIQHRKDMDLFE